MRQKMALKPKNNQSFFIILKLAVVPDPSRVKTDQTVLW